MDDQIRNKWIKENDDQESVDFFDASDTRKHKSIVRNNTRVPIIIGRISLKRSSEDKRNNLCLKVIGDGMALGGILPGFADIRHFSDEELDKCSPYMDYLNKGWFTELTEEEYSQAKLQVEEFCWRMQNDKNFYWQVRNQEILAKQAYAQQANAPRMAEPIMEFYSNDGGVTWKSGSENSQRLFEEDDSVRATQHDQRFGGMSEYFRAIKRF